VSTAPDFELLAPARLALFCFRFHPSGIDDPQTLDALNERLLETLNDSGSVYFTQTRVRGRYCIRWSIGQTSTEERHVAAAWEQIQRTARGLRRAAA
jgi:aromatic-L-amino-acid decarboxylase